MSNGNGASPAWPGAAFSLAPARGPTPPWSRPGTFYPAREMTPADRLAHYAGQFPIVEVDATYYAPPAERTAGLWVERTPPDFTFDVKAFRLLTQHPTPPRTLWKDLAAALPDDLKAKKNLYARDLPRELLAEAFDRFVSALLPLHSAGKLGVVLFQLPPYVVPSRGAYGYLSWAAERLAEYRVAVEFRQQRWMDEAHRDSTLAFLEEHQLSYVCVDAPQGFRSSMPPVAAATAALAEVRFHGRNQETWEAPGHRRRREVPLRLLPGRVAGVGAAGEGPGRAGRPGARAHEQLLRRLRGQERPATRHAARTSRGEDGGVERLGPAPHPPARQSAGRPLLPHRPVHRFPDEIGVAVVPGVLLDHVNQDPAQAGGLTGGPGTPGKLPQAIVRQGFGQKRPGALRRLVPEREQLLRESSAAECHSQSGSAFQSTVSHGGCLARPCRLCENQ